MAEKKRVDDYSFEQESSEYDSLQLEAVKAELARITDQLADATKRRKTAVGLDAIGAASKVYELTQKLRESERNKNLLDQRIQKSKRAHMEGREQLLSKDPINTEIN